jgi:hypothetical protein
VAGSTQRRARSNRDRRRPRRGRLRPGRRLPRRRHALQRAAARTRHRHRDLLAQGPARTAQARHPHDALGYYANRYGLEVIGTVIPSLSTAGQPSAGETAELTEVIEHEKVRAIFTESSVNAKVEQAIARETGADIGRALWADSLGTPGSDGETYLKSLASNTRSLVDGLTGGAVSCTLPA